MNKDDVIVMPYVIHEGVVVHFERVNKRLSIILAIVIALLFLSNCAWLYAWMQYDYSSSATTETITIDGKDGVANYIGNDGDINNGKDYGAESNNDENTGQNTNE